MTKENKNEELNVKIEVKKHKKIEMIYSILNAMLNDERIPKHIREEYSFIEMALYN